MPGCAGAKFGLSEECGPVQGTVLAWCRVGEVFSLHSYATWLHWQNFKAQPPHSVASSSYLCNTVCPLTTKQLCAVGAVRSHLLVQHLGH